MLESANWRSWRCRLSVAAASFIAVGGGCGKDGGALEPAAAGGTGGAETDLSATDLSPEPPTSPGMGGSSASEIDPDVPLDTSARPDEPAMTQGTSPAAGTCSDNRDCVAGLSCVTVMGNSSTAVHYVGGGYCSTECIDDVDCASFGEGSHCYRGLFGIERGFCLASCTPGAAEADKCNGRSDLLCFGQAGEAGSCDLGCTQHVDCGLDLCDLGNGQCRRILASAPSRSPIGSVCPADQPVTCNGFCVGEPGETGLCTGRCRLGESCQGSNVCAPSDANLRPGDFGLCELGCQTSADCAQGVTACAPTGFTSTSGEPERSCVPAPGAESFANQRLSVEQMALPLIPPEVVAVRSFGVGDTLHRLTASESGVCISGTRDAAESPAVLVFQFGTGNGAPFDASAFDTLVFDYSGASSVLVQSQLTNRPGTFYEHSIEGVLLASGPGETRMPFDRFAGEATDPAWDPEQLEAIRLAVIGNAFEPFEVCVTALGFE